MDASRDGNPAFGTAILCEDLLRVIGERPRARRRAAIAWARDAAPPFTLRRLRARLGRDVGGPLSTRLPPAARCPACAELAHAEQRYFEAALRFVDDPAFEPPTRRRHGCACRTRSRALELAAGGPAGDRLLARTLPKWADLRRDLAGSWKARPPEPRAVHRGREHRAHPRAIEALHGQAGLFANDLRWPARSERRASPQRRVGVESAREPSIGEEHRSCSSVSCWSDSAARSGPCSGSHLRARRPLARGSVPLRDADREPRRLLRHRPRAPGRPAIPCSSPTTSASSSRPASWAGSRPIPRSATRQPA